MNSPTNKEEILKESREYLSQIISGSPIPTFVIDNNHIVTHFNKACETLTGINAEDIIGTGNQWKAFYKSKRPVMADFILDEASDEKIETFYKGKYRPSKVKKGAYEAEDFFPDLGDDGKWLFFTAVPLKNTAGEVVGAIETLQDITRVRQTSKLNEAMLRISNSLHVYPYLEDLLGYISTEIRQLLGTEGALVILHDEEADELYFPGIAYNDPDTESRVREIRFAPDQIVAGQVIQTGKPVIINEESAVEKFHERDKRLGYRTRTLVEVPVHSDDRIIGVLSGINKIDGLFNQKDVELLNTLAGTVALAIENARYAEDIREAYREVTALNKAKDKAINHLSHELNTPVAILSDAVDLIEDELAVVPEEEWRPFIDMIYRNLKRITEIQEEVSDIIKNDTSKKSGLMMSLFEECCDEIALIVAKNNADENIAERVKTILKERFFRSEDEPALINVGDFVGRHIKQIKQTATHRRVEISYEYSEGREIEIPEQIFSKIVDGLIKNAVENTPDGGRVEIGVFANGSRTLLTVRDYGVGILEDYSTRIFEGFFPTQEITAYSTKQPFDFDAGGKGADLLRMKIFSEKYNFSIKMESARCRYLKGTDYQCPGNITQCDQCSDAGDCLNSGGTIFYVEF